MEKKFKFTAYIVEQEEDQMKNILSGKELLRRLDAEDWKSLIPKIHYYALNKLERYPFLHDLYQVNDLANQFADDAIGMVWEEQRKWNIDYYADLYSFLKGIVDSLVSNFINLREVEVTEAIPEGDYLDFAAIGSDPEYEYVHQETEQEIALILREDEEAAEVFDCLKAGLKPREIVDELGWDIGKVRNVIKRVHRKLKDFAQINK